MVRVPAGELCRSGALPQAPLVIPNLSVMIEVSGEVALRQVDSDAGLLFRLFGVIRVAVAAPVHTSAAPPRITAAAKSASETASTEPAAEITAAAEAFAEAFGEAAAPPIAPTTLAPTTLAPTTLAPTTLPVASPGLLATTAAPLGESLRIQHDNQHGHSDNGTCRAR